MIVADTGVWIEYFNGKSNEYTDFLDNSLAEGLVVIGDTIFLEILQGFRNDSHFKQARSTLSTLDHYKCSVQKWWSNALRIINLSENAG